MKKGEITSSSKGKDTSAEEIKRLEASLPSDPSSIKLTECELPVDTKIARTLIATWKAVLLRTQYDDGSQFRLDGESYHFSMHSGYQELAGKVWSPPEDTDVGRLISIVYSVKKSCKVAAKEFPEQLRQQITELGARLSVPEASSDLKK